MLKQKHTTFNPHVICFVHSKPDTETDAAENAQSRTEETACDSNEIAEDHV